MIQISYIILEDRFCKFTNYYNIAQCLRIIPIILNKQIKASFNIETLSKKTCKTQKNIEYQEPELKSQLLILFKKTCQTSLKITKKWFVFKRKAIYNEFYSYYLVKIPRKKPNTKNFGFLIDNYIDLYNVLESIFESPPRNYKVIFYYIVNNIQY